MPPREVPKTARSIRTEDVDRGVKRWFDRAVDAYVSHPDGGRMKVPVRFASGERWVAASDRQGIRDKNGQLILPVIQVHRQSFDPVTPSTALGSNVPRLQVARRVSEKTTTLANLDQSRPISQRRLRDSAVYEIVTVPFPVSGKMNYKVRLQASTIQHMNEIVEKVMSCLEFFDVPSFVISMEGSERPEGDKVGQGSTELIPEDHSSFDLRTPIADYYFVGYLDGDWSDGGNLDEFTDQERIIQMDFGFHVPVALQLDPEGKRPAVQVERTAFSVRMGEEEVHAVDDPAELDKIFGPFK